MILRQYDNKQLQITRQLTLSKPQKHILRNIHKTFRRVKQKEHLQLNIQTVDNLCMSNEPISLRDSAFNDENDHEEEISQIVNNNYNRRFKSGIISRFGKDSKICMSPIERKALQSPSPNRDFDIQRNNLK